MKAEREVLREKKLNSVRKVALETRKEELLNEIQKCMQLCGQETRVHIRCLEAELWQICDELASL